MKTLYTLGYEKLSLDEVLGALERFGIRMLIDVRQLPLSRKPGFSKRGLERSLLSRGIAYCHARPLGNPKPGRAAARKGDHATFRRIYRSHLESEAAQAALDGVATLASGTTACLLCFERDSEWCHRSLVADALERRSGFEIHHLREGA